MELGLADQLSNFLSFEMAYGLRRLTVFLSALAVGTSAAAPPYGFPDCTAAPLKGNAVCDVTKDPITRATALIDLWTDTEPLNNTVNSSPGVPRLGLPAYNWWSEGLVSNHLGILVLLHQEFILLFLLARRCFQSRGKLYSLRRLQPCDLLPSAHPHGRRI